MATAHTLNGGTITHEEPYPFIDQAHALALITEGAIRNGEQEGGFNDHIMASAVRGIATLIELASIGLKAMDDMQRRAGR